jgi:hypothetical protein
MVDTVPVGQNIPTSSFNTTTQSLIDKIVSGGRIVVDFLSPASWMEGGKHKGIDIGAKPGTVIRSPVEGTLVDPQKYGLKGYGNAITVLDPSGDLHIFGHTTGTLQSYGTKVNIGDLLSTIEDHLHPAKPNTGSDTTFGDHLHYEIRQPGANGLPDYNRSMNPLEYLRSVDTQPGGQNISQGGKQSNPGGGVDNPQDSTGGGSVPFEIPVVTGKLGPWDVGLKLNVAYTIKILLSLLAFGMIAYGLMLVFGANKIIDQTVEKVVDKVIP